VAALVLVAATLDQRPSVARVVGIDATWSGKLGLETRSFVLVVAMVIRKKRTQSWCGSMALGALRG
jgi:hypothetical protein